MEDGSTHIWRHQVLENGRTKSVVVSIPKSAALEQFYQNNAHHLG
jgi:hypothetical protein